MGDETRGNAHIESLVLADYLLLLRSWLDVPSMSSKVLTIIFGSALYSSELLITLDTLLIFI